MCTLNIRSLHILNMDTQILMILLTEQHVDANSVAPRAAEADVAFGEDAIDILEFQTLGLGIEDVDDGDPDGVEDGEDDVGLPANVLDGGRGDLDDEEVADPVASGGY